MTLIGIEKPKEGLKEDCIFNFSSGNLYLNTTNSDITEIFARATKGNKTGLERFKREALGFFRRKTRLNLDQMARILYKIGAASSEEEGREITPRICGLDVTYGHTLSGCQKQIHIYEENPNTDKKYVVEAWTWDIGI